MASVIPARGANGAPFPPSQPSQTFGEDLRLRPLDRDELLPDLNAQEISAKARPRTFLRGALSGGVAAAAGYAAPYSAAYAGLAALAKLGVLTGAGIICGAASTPVAKTTTPKERVWNAMAAIFTATVGAVVGATMAASPHFIALGGAYKLAIWAGFGLTLGGLNTISMRHPTLMCTALLGATVGASALLYWVSTPTALQLAAAGALGVGIGACLHKWSTQFAQHAGENMLAIAAFVAALAFYGMTCL